MKDKNSQIVIKNARFRVITFFNDHIEIVESIFSSKNRVPYEKVSNIVFEKYFYSQYIDDCMTIDYLHTDGKKKKIVIEITEKDFLRVTDLIKDKNITIEKKQNHWAI